MSWERKKIGDLCSITKGKIGITKAIPGEYPLVVTSEERKSHNEFHFEGEAVVIPLVSSTGHGHRSLKRIHYQKGKFAVGNILCAVIPNDSSILSTEYLYRFLDLNREKELVSRMRGMANVTLPMQEIANIEIPLPSLDEQKKFVEEYKELETANNALSAEISSQLDLVKQLRQAFLREAMQGKLIEQNEADEPTTELLAEIKAEKEQLIKEKKIKKQKPLPPISEDEISFKIPESWVWCRLGEIAEIGTGATPLTSNLEFYKDGNVPWITSSVTNNLFVESPEQYITEKAIKETNCKVYPSGTLVVAMYGQGKTRGQITELKFDAATNQACATISLHLNKFYMRKYIKQYFQNIYLEIRELAQGGAQPNLNMGKISNTNIPFPPLSEQKRIVAKLDELMAYCDSLEESIKNSQTQNALLLGQVLREALEPEEKSIKEEVL